MPTVCNTIGLHAIVNKLQDIPAALIISACLPNTCRATRYSAQDKQTFRQQRQEQPPVTVDKKTPSISPYSLYYRMSYSRLLQVERFRFAQRCDRFYSMYRRRSFILTTQRVPKKMNKIISERATLTRHFQKHPVRLWQRFFPRCGKYER